MKKETMNAGDDSYYHKGDRRVVHRNNEFSQMIERRDLMAIESGKLVLVMVGLPGRGKSYISRRLELFMSWLGDTVKVFNVGKYRRNVEHPDSSGKVFPISCGASMRLIPCHSLSLPCLH